MNFLPKLFFVLFYGLETARNHSSPLLSNFEFGGGTKNFWFHCKIIPSRLFCFECCNKRRFRSVRTVGKLHFEKVLQNIIYVTALHLACSFSATNNSMHSITETSFLLHTENLTFHESKHFLQHWTVVMYEIKQRSYDVTWKLNRSAAKSDFRVKFNFSLSNNLRRIVHLWWQGLKLLRAFSFFISETFAIFWLPCYRLTLAVQIFNKLSH